MEVLTLVTTVGLLLLAQQFDVLFLMAVNEQVVASSVQGLQSDLWTYAT